MDNLINQLIQENIGQVLDKRRDRLLMGNEVYQQDCTDTQELLNRYEALNLERSDRLLINDLICCMETHVSNQIFYIRPFTVPAPLPEACQIFPYMHPP